MKGRVTVPICSQCKAEYIRGKRFCSFCGEELYRGLLTDLSDDEEIFNQIEWVKVTSVTSESDAEMILKQLMVLNVPAIKRSQELPFNGMGVHPNPSIDIYVPQWLEEKAMEIIN